MPSTDGSQRPSPSSESDTSAFESPRNSLAFAESSARTEQYATASRGSPSTPLSRTLATCDDRQLYFTQTPYPTIPPPLCEIQKGVCQYGSNVVYTADHPQVQAVINEANATWSLPRNVPSHFLALAALQVFYFPNSPAHWLFWSDERKKETAHLVNGIALKHPPVIHCSITSWNGSEYLNLLYGVHSASHELEDQEWFPVLVPKKEKELTRAQTLRNRKRAQPADSPETAARSVEQVCEEAVHEPPRKRPKTKRSNSDRKTSSSLKEDATSMEHSEHTHIEAAEVAVIVTPASITDLPISTSPTSSLSSLPDADAPEISVSATPRRTSTRRRQPKKAYDATPAPSLSISSTASSRAPSVIPAPPAPKHLRVRSTSQSSAETLVACCRSRSMSRSSADTIVPSGQIKKVKGTLKKAGAAPVDDSVEIETIEPVLCATETQPQEGMVTRSMKERSDLIPRRAGPNLAGAGTRDAPSAKGETKSCRPKPAPKNKRMAKKSLA